MQKLIEEMESYYLPRYSKRLWPFKDPLNEVEGLRDIFALPLRIHALMDDYLATHPNAGALELKNRFYEVVLEKFEPVIFPHNPFFFEMGTRPGDNVGETQHWLNGASWMHRKRNRLMEETEAGKRLKLRHEIGIDHTYGIVDVDHYSIGYTKVLEKGLAGIIADAKASIEGCETQRERDFLNSIVRGLETIIAASEKFARKAKAMLADCADEESRRFLSMIAESARHVPRNPPRSYYEGLASMLFVRESMISFEGIGVSAMGHPDRSLIDLYRQDLAAGRTTREEALDLTARWLSYTDIKFNVKANAWPETDSAIVLGGCDAAGAPIDNEVTELFIDAYEKHDFVSPKINFRYSCRSDAKLFDTVSRQIVNGKNIYAFFNDDCLVEANVKSGKAVEDCRLYVAGGCQEPILEGKEHSAIGSWYVSLLKVFEWSLLDCDENDDPETLGLKIEKATEQNGFEDFYSTVMKNLKTVLVQGAALRSAAGAAWPEVNPVPAFSATIDDCLVKRKDITEGGGRYNPEGVCFVGLGTFVDSLYAVKKACFDNRTIPLVELKKILDADWKGHEAIRQQVMNIGKYGNDIEEIDLFAGRVAQEIGRACAGLINQRGGPFLPNFFCYNHYIDMGQKTKATPDGRKSGEELSQGVSPSRLNKEIPMTNLFNSIEKIDFTDFPGNAIYDVMLPAGNIPPDTVASCLKVFAKKGGPTIQFNCINEVELTEAQKRPEHYGHLVVRLNGLSARFVSLSRETQSEIIHRTLFHR